MKTNPNLKLRKLGSSYIIVQASSREVDMSSVYTLNSTAAFLWEKSASHPEIDLTPRVMADWLVSEYGIDLDTAENDAKEIFDVWKEFDLIG